ncbi:MAG: carbohydrate-binding family 9-like protein [Janthinobacterium lividum]
MESLKIPFLKLSESNSALSEISLLLQKLESNAIRYAPWQKSFKKPSATFSLAYADDLLYIRYIVKEPHVIATYTENNEPVYKDSCVEFFIAFENDPNYYNLEFNCLGTVLAAYGPRKENRIVLPKAVLKDIASETVITSYSNDHDITWEITISIPLKTFLFHQLDHLSKKKCRVNFYKCGDDLPEPHFLCWNNIVNDTPNFHLPQYFGLGEFS